MIKLKDIIALQYIVDTNNQILNALLKFIIFSTKIIAEK